MVLRLGGVRMTPEELKLDIDRTEKKLEESQVKMCMRQIL